MQRQWMLQASRSLLESWSVRCLYAFLLSVHFPEPGYPPSWQILCEPASRMAEPAGVFWAAEEKASGRGCSGSFWGKAGLATRLGLNSGFHSLSSAQNPLRRRCPGRPGRPRHRSMSSGAADFPLPAVVTPAGGGRCRGDQRGRWPPGQEMLLAVCVPKPQLPSPAGRPLLNGIHQSVPQTQMDVAKVIGWQEFQQPWRILSLCKHQ